MCAHPSNLYEGLLRPGNAVILFQSASPMVTALVKILIVSYRECLTLNASKLRKQLTLFMVKTCRKFPPSAGAKFKKWLCILCSKQASTQQRMAESLNDLPRGQLHTELLYDCGPGGIFIRLNRMREDS